jgi:hypothetical protein
VTPGEEQNIEILAKRIRRLMSIKKEIQAMTVEDTHKLLVAYPGLVQDMAISEMAARQAFAKAKDNYAYSMTPRRWLYGRKN